MSDVFLSYASEDRDRASQLAGALEQHRLSVWWDRTALARESFVEMVRDEFEAAGCVVVLWSRASVHSKFVQIEAAAGKRRGILIAAMLDDVAADLPSEFSRMPAAHLMNWTPERPHPEFEAMVEVIRRLLSEEVARPAGHPKELPTAEPRSPKKSRSWLKYLSLALAGVLLTLAVLATGLFFYLSQPDRPPVRQTVASVKHVTLDDYVGEYRLPDGTRSILTYSAKGGLALYALVDARFARADYLSHRFTPLRNGEFRWDLSDGGASRIVRFVTDPDGATLFEWNDKKGTVQRARRMTTDYSQLEVDWRNGEVELSGTAFIPENPVTGTVLMHGSGDSDRDNLWYLHLALHLVGEDVAVLLPDKRGSGKSSGDWRTTSFGDFARDYLEGRTALASLAGLAESRIGLVGISQAGSWVAPKALTFVDDLPFVVSVSGAAVTANDQLAHETRQTLRNAGIPSFLDVIVHPYAVAIPKRRRSVWWNMNGSYDPLADWEATAVPVLVLFGGKDEFDNVPVSVSVERLSGAASRSDFEVRVFEGVGHGLYDPDSREIRRDFLTALVEWAMRYGTAPSPDIGQRPNPQSSSPSTDSDLVPAPKFP